MSSANESLGFPVGGRREGGEEVTRGGRFDCFGDWILGSTAADTDGRDPPVNMLNMSSKVSSFAGDFRFRSGDSATIFGGEGVGRVSIGADFRASRASSFDSVSTSGCRSTANARASVLLPTNPFAASTNASSVTSRTHREAASVNTHAVASSPRRLALGPSSFALFNNRAVSPSDPESDTASYIGGSSSSTAGGGGFGAGRPPLRGFFALGGCAALITLSGNRLVRLFAAAVIARASERDRPTGSAAGRMRLHARCARTPASFLRVRGVRGACK